MSELFVHSHQLRRDLSSNLIREVVWWTGLWWSLVHAVPNVHYTDESLPVCRTVLVLFTDNRQNYISKAETRSVRDMSKTRALLSAESIIWCILTKHKLMQLLRSPVAYQTQNTSSESELIQQKRFTGNCHSFHTTTIVRFPRKKKHVTIPSLHLPSVKTVGWYDVHCKDARERSITSLLSVISVYLWNKA